MSRTRPSFAWRLIAGLLLAAPLGSALAQIVAGDVTITRMVTGISTPVGVFSAPEPAGRLFVIQKGGEIRLVTGTTLVTTPFHDISTSPALQCRYPGDSALTTVGFLGSGSEQGLLGLAFHPNFTGQGAGRGVFFVSFSDANGDSMIARYTMADPAANALTANDRDTCTVILRVDQDFTNHNGGNIMFGPDGFLYFGLGDGGDGNDTCNRGQTLDPANLDASGSCAPDTNFTSNGGDPNSRALLGKMLRLNVNGTTPASTAGICGAPRVGQPVEYAIPSGQPSATGGNIPQACDEVWAYGLRNPWRWSFDRQTNDLWIGDVGQDTWEEVDVWRSGTDLPGTDFGWKICEGRRLRGNCSTACTTANGRLDPVIVYTNSGNSCGASATSPGCSVTGGYRYRGPTSVLNGAYFYGDACNSELRFSNNTGGNNWVEPTAANIITTDSQGTGLAGSILGFGEDQGGALFFVAGGALYRIGGASVVPPADLVFSNGFE